MSAGFDYSENVEDLNGDDKADILWRDTITGQNRVLLMDGTTTTDAAALPGLSLAWDPVGYGDYNSDGKTDLIWRNNSTGDNAMWLMDGTTVASAATLPGFS